MIILFFLGFTTPGHDLLRGMETGILTAITPVTNSVSVAFGHVAEGTDSLVHVTSLSRENKKMSLLH